MTKAHLVKEQMVAVERFKEALIASPNPPHSNRLVTVQDLKEGVCFFSSQFLQDNLPHGNNWSWNQSIASVVERLDSINVRIFKYNARRNKNATIVPKAKVWIIEVWCADTNVFLYSFYWCEIGLFHELLSVTPLVSISKKSSRISRSKRTTAKIPTDKLEYPRSAMLDELVLDNLLAALLDLYK